MKLVIKEWIRKNELTIEKYVRYLEKEVFEFQDKEAQLHSILRIVGDITDVLRVGFSDIVTYHEVLSLWIAVGMVIANIYKYKINKEASLLLVAKTRDQIISDVFFLRIEVDRLSLFGRFDSDAGISMVRLSGLTTQISTDVSRFFEFLRISPPKLYDLCTTIESDATKDAAIVKEALIEALQNIPLTVRKSLVVKTIFLEALGSIYLDGKATYFVEDALKSLKAEVSVTDTIDEPAQLPGESPIPQLRDYKRVEQEVKQAEERAEQANEELERTKERLKQFQKDLESLIANTDDVATLYHIWPFNIDNNKAVRNRLKELYKGQIPDDATPWFYEKPVRQYKYLQVCWSRTVEEDGEKIPEEGSIHLGNVEKYGLSSKNKSNEKK